MSISADNKTRACQWLPEKIFNLLPSAHAFRISLLAGGPRLRPDLHHQIIHIHLQESKTIRRNPGYSNPLSQHWDHIITTSITRRTVRPWLVMMMTSRARVQWHGRIVFIIVSDTSVNHGRPLSNSSETPQCATTRSDQQGTSRIFERRT